MLLVLSFHLVLLSMYPLVPTVCYRICYRRHRRRRKPRNSFLTSLKSSPCPCSLEDRFSPTFSRSSSRRGFWE